MKDKGNKKAKASKALPPKKAAKLLPAKAGADEFDSEINRRKMVSGLAAKAEQEERARGNKGPTEAKLPGMDEHAKKLAEEKRKKAEKAAMEGPLRIHVSKTIATERTETGSVIVTAHAEVVDEHEPYRYLEACALKRKGVKLSIKAYSAIGRVKEVRTGGDGGEEGKSWTALTIVGPASLDGVCGKTVTIEADDAIEVE